MISELVDESAAMITPPAFTVTLAGVADDCASGVAPGVFWVPVATPVLPAGGVFWLRLEMPWPSVPWAPESPESTERSTMARRAASALRR